MNEASTEKDKIVAKDWLDLSWKHFQQHAQQRISYFNFFVIFSTILTSALVTTFQKSYEAPFIAIAIGVVQSFLAVMFIKIDLRNRFLTKHAEKTLRSLESTYGAESNPGTQLFTLEEKETIARKLEDTKTGWRKKMLTHGESYLLIYRFFLLWGILEIAAPFLPNNSNETVTQVSASVTLKYDKVDSLNSLLRKRDSLTQMLFKEVKDLSTKIDDIQLQYQEQQKPK